MRYLLLVVPDIRRQREWHLHYPLRLQLVRQTLSVAQICAYEWVTLRLWRSEAYHPAALATASKVNDADPVSYTVLGNIERADPRCHETHQS
jgi:hypothetical protein